MRIQNNIPSLNARRNLTINNGAVSKDLEKLSSGLSINRAGDDAAGLAISEQMRSQITGLDIAERNSTDGISLIQTAEGALSEVHSMLNRMVELASHATNSIYDDEIDRAALQDEVDQLKTEIDRVSKEANFNKQPLLSGVIGNFKTYEINSADPAVDLRIDLMGTIDDGSENGKVYGLDIKFEYGNPEGAKLDDTVNPAKLTVSLDKEKEYSAEDIGELLKNVEGNPKEIAELVRNATVVGLGVRISENGNSLNINVEDKNALHPEAGLKLQVGATDDLYNKIEVSIKEMSTNSLGLSKVNIGTQSSAGYAIDAINAAIASVSIQRGELGAVHNSLEHAVRNLNLTGVNMTDAESRIRDANMAGEMMKFTKDNIVSQASQSMLAQANQTPQAVLQMLQ